MVQDVAPREADMAKIVEGMLVERLPAQWAVLPGDRASAGYDRKLDALLALQAPDGARVQVAIECKRNLVTRDLYGVMQQLNQAMAALDKGAVGLVAAPYLSTAVRAWLEEAGASYADATGNLRLVSDRPAVYLRDRGADKDPWRGPGRPRGTLKGVPATRVVRALVDYAPPMSVRVLVERSGASTGAAYRVVDFLDQEALIKRGDGGEVAQVDWPRLLRRWSEDYSFAGDSVVTTCLQPRGIPAVLEHLPRLESVMDYAVTGSLAAQVWAPYAQPRLATIFVEDPSVAIDLLGLRAVDKGANVMIAMPSSPAVFARSKRVGGIRYASPSQVVADLLTGPGRSPAEGEELIRWMENNESSWRS